jgi:cell division protein FtsN
MSRNPGNNSSSPRKGGSQLLTGILLGTVIGAGLAAGVAWYLKNSPGPFIKREHAAIGPPAESAPRTQPATTASGADSGKPRFEFYKVLTDKQGANVAAPERPAEKPKAADNKPAAIYEPQILQAGSFSNETDAEKLKAKLALLGVESGIQAATIPDKGIWYRVRLGPYKTEDEMNHARNFLKQNGVESTPMRTQ